MTDTEIEQEVHSISMELDSAEHDLVSSIIRYYDQKGQRIDHQDIIGLLEELRGMKL